MSHFQHAGQQLEHRVQETGEVLSRITSPQLADEPQEADSTRPHQAPRPQRVHLAPTISAPPPKVDPPKPFSGATMDGQAVESWLYSMNLFFLAAAIPEP